MMRIKELLWHVYPSCNVTIYCEGDEELEFLAGDLAEPEESLKLIANSEFSDWALYTHFLAIFM